MDYKNYDNASYHDSHCTGPNCNCDDRRYGYHGKTSSHDWIWVVVYLVIGFMCPPLGAIVMLFWIFH